MIALLRRLLSREGLRSELEQMRRNRDYWREAAIAATDRVECQQERMAELREALRDCLAQLELTGEPFLDEAVHAGRAALARGAP